jgi:signal peptidase I
MENDSANSGWISGSQYDSNNSNLEKKGVFARFVDLIFDFLQSIALGGAFFIVIYLFLMQPHQIKGNSMFPTYEDKEYVLTDKISYKFTSPKRGDVVILKSPENPDIDFIKRVIGLPNEKVKITDGKVFINDQVLTETYIDVETPVFPAGFMQDNTEVIVPADSFFVMGDNRPGSSDSREFGFVPMNNIVGRVFFRYYPVARMGKITAVEYSF